MSASSTTLHEDRDALTIETVDLHRGFVSLVEELEAIDWYNQRVEATRDVSLTEILKHNREEEKEHAMMLLEWLRRHDPALDEQMRIFLFAKSGTSVVGQEESADAAGGSPPAYGSLGIGTLKEAQA